MTDKKDLEKRIKKLETVIAQETIHLKALCLINSIKDNHFILSALDLSIFKLRDVLLGDNEVEE